MSDDTTQETENNLEYLGSIIASLVIIGTMLLLGAVALGVATLGPIPQAWFIAIIVPLVIMAAIQVFGKDVYQVFKKSQE